MEQGKKERVVSGVAPPCNNIRRQRHAVMRPQSHDAASPIQLCGNTTTATVGNPDSVTDKENPQHRVHDLADFQPACPPTAHPGPMMGGTIPGLSLLGAELHTKQRRALAAPSVRSAHVLFPLNGTSEALAAKKGAYVAAFPLPVLSTHMSSLAGLPARTSQTCWLSGTAQRRETDTRILLS